jgi:hypothetical protein
MEVKYIKFEMYCLILYIRQKIKIFYFKSFSHFDTKVSQSAVEK